MFAQTNVQLFNQLQELGYSDSDFELIAEAYRFSQELFVGKYRSSGKTFIAHAVGTASILASIKTSSELIAGALLHSAYKHGDFGELSRRITNSKRVLIQKRVGVKVEDYVFRFADFTWNAKSRQEILANVEQFSDVDKGVVLLRIANEIEEHLDKGVIFNYCRR